MHIKSLFCNHSPLFSELVLPNGQKRIKEQCANCGKIKIYCAHDYEIIARACKEGCSFEGFNGSLAAFKEVEPYLRATTDILFKCKHCGDLRKETLRGEEVNNNRHD
jgi:hypothetical protein